MLAAMFSGRMSVKRDRNNRYFIDRDGKLFSFILNYLRTGLVHVDKRQEDIEAILEEAEFFALDELCNYLKSELQKIQERIQLESILASQPSRIVRRRRARTISLSSEMSSVSHVSTRSQPVQTPFEYAAVDMPHHAQYQTVTHMEDDITSDDELEPEQDFAQESGEQQSQVAAPQAYVPVEFDQSLFEMAPDF